MNKQKKVTVVTFPVSKAFITPLSNLVDIFCAFSERVNVISGCVEKLTLNTKFNNVRIYKVVHKGSANFFIGIIKYVSTQVQLSLLMHSLAKDTDIFVFFGQGPPLLNVLMAKVLRKRIAWMLPSSLLKTSQAQRHSMSRMLAYLQPPCYVMSDMIILYSENLVNEWGLSKYRKKISIAHQHYIDTGIFAMNKELYERGDTIGYIGRFSREKGILELMRSVPRILGEMPDAKFLFVGNGPLAGQVKEFIGDNSLNDEVHIVDWISHGDLPDYYNKLKLLVLPSYTEGLPNVVIEAMACGTPVLVTSVGAIPDIVTDGVTGFILDDTSPDHIAENIVRALNHPDLNKIAINARRFISENYVYEATTRKFEHVFDDMVDVKMHLR